MYVFGMVRAARVLGIVVAVLLVALLSAPFLISANQFRPLIEGKLSSALGRQVALGDLRVSLFAGGVNAAGLTIGEDPALGPGQGRSVRYPICRGMLPRRSR